MKKYFHVRERGDTIVEVLICMALLSVILTGAYITSNNSLRSERDTQEHAEAVTLAQSQVESLESLALQGTPFVFQPGDRCLYILSGVITAFKPSPLQPHCYIPSNNLTASPPISAPAAIPAPYYYDISLTPDTSTSVKISGTDAYGNSVLQQLTLTTYNIQVAWDSLNGGTDLVQLYYRPN